MQTVQKILDYLDLHLNHKERICCLAQNSNIQCGEYAYNFDKIKNCICGDKMRTCDALYINKNINLIEFKTGFDAPESNASDTLKKENMLLKIQIKAGDSLRILENFILKKAINGDEEIRARKIMCAVIDSNEPVIAEHVYVDILSEHAGSQVSSNWKENVAAALSKYRKESLSGGKLFYDDTFVLYDYEFDENFCRFK